MSMNFEQQRQDYIRQTEAYLQNCFTWPALPQQKLFEAMRYSLLAGGKRLRPVYVLEFCRMCGGDWHRAMAFAAAIEMVHTYSLIHDDLPCMDNDDYRRGKLTNHKVFGQANAVLAGDALLTEAFTTLTNADLDVKQIAQGVRILATAAGALGMVGGQVLDLEAEEKHCTAKEVQAIHTRKTGALICAACCLGVTAANGSAQQVEAAQTYAQGIGLAFQIRDDMLDVIGNREKLGKATGADGKKNTFVSLYGLEKCEKMVGEETQKALQALQVFPAHTFLTTLSEQLIHRDH